MSMADRDGWIWYDGKMVPWRDATTHVLTHTLHYGMGVFEGVRCYKTADGPGDLPPARPHRPAVPLGAHLRHEDPVHARTRSTRRSSRACATTSSTPATSGRSRSTARDAMGVAAKSNPVRVAIAAWPWGAYLGADGLEKGIRVKTSSFTHHHPNITMCNAKAVCNYAVSILANQEATHDGYEEAMLLDPQGFVCQGSGENVFIVRDGKLHTPDLSGGALERHHARHDHHVRATSSASRCTSGASRATRSTSPTRRSSPAPPPRSRRSASSTTGTIGEGARGPITDAAAGAVLRHGQRPQSREEGMADEGVTMAETARAAPPSRSTPRTCRSFCPNPRDAAVVVASARVPRHRRRPARRCARIAARATARGRPAPGGGH